MSIYKDLRNQNKTDSRRFGKGIICKIVYGPLLDFIGQQGIGPRNVFFNTKTGLDTRNKRMLVIPADKYKYIEKIFNDRSQVVANTNATDDLELFEKISRAHEALLQAIKQSIILITMDFSSLPEARKAGADPAGYDVMIDSIDVNQNIIGQYVYKTVENFRAEYSWNQDFDNE